METIDLLFVLVITVIEALDFSATTFTEIIVPHNLFVNIERAQGIHFCLCQSIGVI